MSRAGVVGSVLAGSLIVLAVAASLALAAGFAKPGSYSYGKPGSNSTGSVSFKINKKGVKVKNFSFYAADCSQKATVKTILFVTSEKFSFEGLATDTSEPTDIDNVIIEGTFSSKKKAKGTATLYCPSTGEGASVKFTAKLKK